MVIATLGALIFWAGWAAWSGMQMTMKAGTTVRRWGGFALALVGVVGFLYGMRVLVSTYLL